MGEIMGKRLRLLREKSGLSQKFVAEQIGVKNNTLSGYESGNREPDSETLTKLADYYKVSTDYLHGRSDNIKGLTAENNNYHSLNEIDKLIKQYDMEQMGFFDIEQWKFLSPQDVKIVEEHFKMIVKLAKERNGEQK
ncbi:helix-turn-helix transcriptional regulator [Niallia taxi]|uniref:helix-turn-helix domain-containing protein n=1 Tax=Niallia taxi TaxID=2499688 RepID=UPI0012450DDF|nr:helix-turn-helix transcriptional regulator [Niallia taxi]MCM3216076.1 helix-turn-helix transcriptional regulator [Niallia taxi]MDK8639235.1 helix-turn-helix transcriptional regulator [Niallia taxi]MED4037039.1 helix-turn-helix transcriptional regulator [Niallia taxi]MED4053145.1 helix-turn-helix transcriptional regulator [Niallia taxi]MED4118985.1 helix-turn-helix transcriptional regulator [Niallia taxi]